MTSTHNKSAVDSYLEGHVRRREKLKERVNAERHNPVDGQEIANYLLGLVKDLSHAEDAGENAKCQMFKEIVTRCACDVAGNAYGVNKHGMKFNGFDNIFDELLKEQGLAGKPKKESLYRKILNCIPLYKKGVVQTPHPTEMLDRKAIEAEIKLHHAIEYLFDKTNGFTHFTGAQKGELEDRLRELFTAITPVQEAMKIPHEMNRSIEFSELTFNAVPQMMHAILDPAMRPRQEYNADGTPTLDKEGKPVMRSLRNNAPLTFDELRHFGRMIEPSTWSPGDRDSKPDMTTEMLEYGIQQNKDVMALQYAVKIGEILESKEMRKLTVSDNKNQSDAYKKLEIIQRRILKNISKEKVSNGFLAHYCDQAGDNVEKQDIRKMVADHIRDASLQDVKPFESSDEMTKSLEDVRQLHGVKFPAFNGSDVLNQLDALVAQMHCFGNYALRAQIRENAEMHEKVMKEMGALFPELGNDRKGRAEKLLGLLSTDRRDELRNKIDDILQEGALPQEDVKNVDLWRKELQMLKDKIGENNYPNEASKNQGKEEVGLLEKKINFYETLSGMKLAAENPDAIPQYLIAECRDSTDILETFALLKLMEPKDTKKHVEIVPLIEYRQPMENIAGIMKEAYANKYFSDHHTAISSDTPALKHEQGKLVKGEDGKPTPLFDRLTVAEVKKAYGIALKDGDETKKIGHTKMVMFAGSDIMKSAGPAAAAFTQYAIEDLRAKMLNWDNPVLLIDYTGSGGGIHRSQPVSTSFETTQGRSMRQTADSIAQKAILTMARFVRRILGLGDDHLPRKTTERKKLAQLNLGNMAGFPIKPQWWEEGTRERCVACMDHYKQLYESPEFSCMLSFSADKFAKITSYAARPTGRIGSSSDTTDYPPIVDVEKLRAIGYGAALNVSGNCASLYYGVSKFLHADEILKGDENALKALVELYRRDPKVQDVINRATFGVTMADLNAAWKYLGVDRAEMASVIKENEATANRLLKGFEKSIKGLAGEDLHDAKMEWLAALMPADKKTLAIHALAKVDVEYQKVSQVLLRLHGIMAGAPEAPDLTRIQDQIIEKLPQALQSQLRASRENIAPVREDLAAQFHTSCEDENSPLRNGVTKLRAEHPEVYNPIYYMMGVLQECFENAPRALTRPYWALAMESQQGLVV